MRRLSLIFKQFSRSVLLIAGFAFLASQARAQGDAAKGEALFKAKCTACHSVTTRMTGPALGPQVTTTETDDKWLYKWVQNNQALIAAKDKRAVDIYNQFNQSSMTVFADLSDGDVGNILTFVRADWKTYQENLKKTTAAAPVDTGTSHMVLWALIALVVASIVVILVLNRAIGTMETVLDLGYHVEHQRSPGLPAGTTD
jgi:cytochrome c551/c552